MHESICELLDYSGYKELIYKEINGRSLRLVYCIPDNDDRIDRDAVVWVHGGGLTGGNALDYVPHSRFMAERGIVGISVEYRLLSEGVTVESCISDVADAVIFIRSNADIFGIDPQKVVAVGESAGGYLVTALITVMKNYDENRRSIPNAVVNCNGVVDLTGDFIYFVSKTPGDRPITVTEQLMEKARKFSPIFHIGGEMPPLLNLQGEQDRTVLPQITQEFHERYTQMGGKSEIVLWRDARHAFIVTGYTATSEQIDRALSEIEKYISRKEWYL